MLVFHGYNPRCTAREVVAGVAGALMQRTFRNLGSAGGGAAAAGGTAAGNPAALRALVDDIRREPQDRHAFVVIHNIDGLGEQRRGACEAVRSRQAVPAGRVLRGSRPVRCTDQSIILTHRLPLGKPGR